MVTGSDLEPVTAFFPSIDRNLIRDLDRQLRGTREPAAAPAAPSVRPDIAGVVEAVEQAAASMAAMTQRIQALESQAYQLEMSNHQLSGQLAEVTEARDSAEEALRTERERGQRVEAFAAHHVSRASALERDLDVARADLAKVVEAINTALGSSGG
jgi:chromosome segregation ATPase